MVCCFRGDATTSGCAQTHSAILDLSSSFTFNSFPPSGDEEPIFFAWNFIPDDSPHLLKPSDLSDGGHWEGDCWQKVRMPPF